MKWFGRPSEKPMSENGEAVLCPRCKGDELIVLKMACRFTKGPGSRVIPTRAYVACSHCFSPFAFRVDQLTKADFKLDAPGKPVGSMAMMNAEDDSASPPEINVPPRRPEELPDDVGEMVRRLNENPGAKLGG